LMQVGTGFGSRFDYNKILLEPEYAIKCGIDVIKLKAKETSDSGKNPTVYEVAWRYNGYTEKGKAYAESFCSLYEELSRSSRNDLVVY